MDDEGEVTPLDALSYAYLTLQELRRMTRASGSSALDALLLAAQTEAAECLRRVPQAPAEKAAAGDAA